MFDRYYSPQTTVATAHWDASMSLMDYEEYSSNFYNQKVSSIKILKYSGQFKCCNNHWS